VSESGGRYQRSMSGMIGALIVTLGVIVAFVVFRAINRDDLDIQRDAIDYTQIVKGLQATDLVVPAYPPTLPEGWIATSAAFEPESGTWELDLLTGEGRFVGVRQSPVAADDLVEAYVDEDATEGDPVELDSVLARDWVSWSDRGGDHAVVTELKDETHLLVVGSAPEGEIEDFAASLVTRRL
jgi:Protein of unknown function (DUF4245)